MSDLIVVADGLGPGSSPRITSAVSVNERFLMLWPTLRACGGAVSD
jgi:hypothetical protein